MPPKRRGRPPSPKGKKSKPAESSSSSSDESSSDEDTSSVSTAKTLNNNAARHISMAIFFSKTALAASATTTSSKTRKSVSSVASESLCLHQPLLGISVQLVVFVKTPVPSEASASPSGAGGNSTRKRIITAITTRSEKNAVAINVSSSSSAAAAVDLQRSQVRAHTTSLGVVSLAAEVLNEVSFTVVDFVAQLALRLGGTLAAAPLIAQSGSRHRFSDCFYTSPNSLLVVVPPQLSHSIEAANAIQHFIVDSAAQQQQQQQQPQQKGGGQQSRYSAAEPAAAKQQQQKSSDLFGAAGAAVAAMRAPAKKRGGAGGGASAAAASKATAVKNYFTDTSHVSVPMAELKKIRESWFNNSKGRRLDLLSGARAHTFGVEVRRSQVLTVDARYLFHLASTTPTTSSSSSSPSSASLSSLNNCVVPEHVVRNILRPSCPETEDSGEWLLPLAQGGFSATNSPFSSFSFSLFDERNKNANGGGAAAAQNSPPQPQPLLLSASGARSQDRASALYQRYVLHDPRFLSGAAVAMFDWAALQSKQEVPTSDESDVISSETLKDVVRHFGGVFWREKFASVKDFAAKVNERLVAASASESTPGEEEIRAYLICTDAQLDFLVQMAEVAERDRKKQQEADVDDDGDDYCADDSDSDKKNTVARARVGKVLCEISTTAWFQACVTCGRRVPSTED